MNTNDIDKAIILLNGMLARDKEATLKLMGHRVSINKDLATADEDFIIGGTESDPSMSVLGLVNSLLLSLTGSRVSMMIDEVDGKIVVIKFEEYQGK